MKKLLLCLSFIIFALSAKSNINLIVDYATFYLQGEKPYIEFYLSINGNSLNYKKNENEKLQASVEITYLIEDGDEVISFKKYQLNSPEYGNEDIILDLIDLTRLSVQNGDFTFTLIAKDLISGKQVETSHELRSIDYSSDEISFSEIQLANQVFASSEESPFLKNGYDINPNFSHFYNTGQEELYFYTEIYNTNILGEQVPFLLEYSIIDAESKKVTANLNAFKRLNTEKTIPVIQSFNLNELPSGKYQLRLRAKNRKNEVIAEQTVDFNRSNTELINFSSVNAENTFVDTLNDKDQLSEYIKSLQPISSYAEQEFAKNQLQYADLKFMQQYFLNFWKSRNAEYPAREWMKYKQEVEEADKEFGYGNIKGYQTERGRVYLQYGKPSAVQDVPYEPETYPYSVWLYNKLNGQTNRKFIFYSPSMEMLGYRVLHSNVQGEVFNPNWEIELMSKTNSGVSPTKETPEGVIINQRARDLFDNPR